MPEIIEVEFHSKYLSDFQMSRLVQASLRKYTVAITAFISDAVIIDDRCLGVSFDHLQQDDAYQTANGGIIRTEKYREHGKKGGFGFLRREKEITSLVASSVGVGDVVFLSCFVPVNVSNLRIEYSGGGTAWHLMNAGQLLGQREISMSCLRR